MTESLLTPSQLIRQIRYDPETKKGSVLDTIHLVMQCDTSVCSRNFASIVKAFPNVMDGVEYHKFPGRGQRPTPVAYVKDLIEIALLCPGKNALKLRHQAAKIQCRLMAADQSLADEIERQHALDRDALLAGIHRPEVKTCPIDAEIK